ncbi:MAG: TIGR03643 family protein [Methylophilaceae bacterium]|nr:TIGR03643 family protein [Methylophilaceae bacterium]
MLLKTTKTINEKSELTEGDISRVIEMAWEDRTTFEAIEAQFGLNQDGVIKIMRTHLKLSSFKLWRKRTHGQVTKHQKLRSSEVTRHKANHRVKQF